MLHLLTRAYSCTQQYGLSLSLTDAAEAAGTASAVVNRRIQAAVGIRADHATRDVVAVTVATPTVAAM